jgi:DNA-binding CsgD family transcriptional regulator/tetratricopeptide (TPR) repeat protein
MVDVLSGLLERDRELKSLADGFERAVAGEASVLLIEGEPGLGKSSLLDHAARIAAERSFKVLRARGGMLERTLGWGIARQLFEDLIVRAPAAERRALLRGSAALAGPVLGVGSVSGEPGPLGDRRLEHGLTWLVSNLTERAPLALLIDDAQWADDAGLEWLLYLVRRAERMPLVLIVATRSGEPDAPRELLDPLAAEPVTSTIVLAALTIGGVEALLERTCHATVDREFGQACLEWTGGNPLFLTHLASELQTGGIEPVRSAAPSVRRLMPAGASRVTLLRLARLSEAAIALARAIAVLESAAQLLIAAKLADLGEDDAVRALDELVDARLLAPGYPLRFAHPLVGGIVYEDQSPGRRAIAHRRAARLLADVGEEPGRVAAQLMRSEPAGDPWVVEELRAAAERELVRGSPATAARLLRRALSEPPAAASITGTLFELGTAESLLGAPEAIETLRRGLAAATDPRTRAEIAVMLGRLLVGTGDPAAAVGVLERVADAVDWDDAGLRLKLEAALVNAARTQVDTLAVIPGRLRAALAHIDDDTHGGRLIAAQLSWGLTAMGAPAARAVELARRGLAGGRLIRDAPEAPEAYLGATHMLAFADELDEADELFGQAIALARRAGSEANFAAASCFRAYTRYLRGALADAELSARDALRTAPDSPALTLIRGLATAYLVLALLERGDVRGAVEVLADGPPAPETAPVTWVTELMFAHGRTQLVQDRPAEAAELLLGCGRRTARWGVVNPAWLPWRSEAALALHAAGPGTESQRLADQELELARQFGARRPIGIALRARGLIERGSAGIELLRESVDVLADSPARLEYARSLVALGCALRRSNRRAEARGPLTDGFQLADRCGARPLAEQARLELEASGSRPRSVIRSGADSLTASERRVCDLALSGKSNPEIAQSLFVSRATVESHLHSAYRKLDISSRSELAGVLSVGAVMPSDAVASHQ